MKIKFNGFITLILVFTIQLNFAQEKIISGTVSDENGLPLAGATIVIKETSSGNSTGFNGDFSLKFYVFHCETYNVVVV